MQFVSMLDFLEHMPDLQTAKEILHKASRAATDFLFIRHPSFEHMGYLKKLGFRISWSYWPVHTNMMTLADYRKVFKAFGWNNYCIIPRKLYTDSSQDCILPLSAPFNTKVYDSETLDRKMLVEFRYPMFEQFDILVKLPESSMTEQQWQELTEKVIDKHSSTEHIEYSNTASGGLVSRLINWLS